MYSDYTFKRHIDRWKIKKFIEDYETARDDVKSMISIIIPAVTEISRFTEMLDEDFQKASNTRSRSVIESAQERLRRYNETLFTGLVLYCGTILTDDGNEKKVTMDFEPYMEIGASIYHFDNKFDTQVLSEFLEEDNEDEKFGFIVMDDEGTLYATLSGNTVEVLHEFSADLPITRQSNFLKRRNYVTRAAELATRFFTSPKTGMCNVSGLVLAGYDGLQTELVQSSRLDYFLRCMIENSVDVSSGGREGLSQAIDLSYKLLEDVKLLQEIYVLRLFSRSMDIHTRRCVFGVHNTLKKFQWKTFEYLIVWENLDINRYVLKLSTTSEIIIKYLNKEKESDQSNFRDSDTNAELEVVEKTSLLEWFAHSHSHDNQSGCRLVFVSDTSREGHEFCSGYGGIGGIIRLHYGYEYGTHVDEIFSKSSNFVEESSDAGEGSSDSSEESSDFGEGPSRFWQRNI